MNQNGLSLVAYLLWLGQRCGLLVCRTPDLCDPQECYAAEPEGETVEDVAVSLCDGVVFVDTSDLPPAEAVIPTTPVKAGSLQNSNEMATDAGSSNDLVSSEFRSSTCSSTSPP